MDSQLTLGSAITDSCTRYAKAHKKSVFIGYNTRYGGGMYGTLKGVAESQLLETPVCENLMMSMAFGMALEGYRPVVCFERHDFLLLALDALVNHIDKMPWISGEQYRLPIIIRAIVGAKEPLNPGPQHTQDYTRALRDMLHHTEVYEPMSLWGLKRAWVELPGKTLSGAVVIIEYKDRYKWVMRDGHRTFQPETATNPLNPTGAR